MATTKYPDCGSQEVPFFGSTPDPLSESDCDDFQNTEIICNICEGILNKSMVPAYREAGKKAFETICIVSSFFLIASIALLIAAKTGNLDKAVGRDDFFESAIRVYDITQMCYATIVIFALLAPISYFLAGSKISAMQCERCKAVTGSE